MAAIHYNQTSGFEVIHGLLDRTMELLEVPRVKVGDKDGYYIQGKHYTQGYFSRYIYSSRIYTLLFQLVKRSAISLVDVLIFLFGEKKLVQWESFIRIH